jgi:hypothetical protein
MQARLQSVKIVLAAAAIATISAAPASARHLRHHHHYSYAPYAYAPRYSQAWSGAYVQGGVPYYPGAYHPGPDPYGVYFGWQKVGRDPDPNVRQQLQNDYSYLYSW